jgi:hypothetical protein
LLREANLHMDVSWRLVKVDNCLYFEPLAPKASYPLLRQAISLSAFFFFNI